MFHLRAPTHEDMMGWLHELGQQTGAHRENALMDCIQKWTEDLELEHASHEEKKLESLSRLAGVLADGEALDHLMQFVLDTQVSGARVAFQGGG